MKLKKIFAGMAASAIAMTTFAMGSASTVSADASVSGTAGVMFQTNLYTARNEAGNDAWGPVDGPAACVPNSVVGVNGGNGWDTSVATTDASINGDGTYSVSIATSGTINTEPDLTKPANKKGWYLDENEKLTRMGSPWSMLGSYEPQNELTEETKQEDIQWGIGDENKATNFNMLIVSTDIPAFYDKENNKCYLDEAMTQEVTVTDVTVDIPGLGTLTAGDTAWKNDLTNVAFSLVNSYDDSGKGSMIDEGSFPTEDGTITVNFTIAFAAGEGGDDSSESGGDSSGDSSEGGDSSAADSSSNGGSSSSNGGGNGGGGSNKGGSGGGTTKNNSTSESLADSASDATENAESGAPAGIALALAAVAGAVVVVSRKKN